MDDAGWDTWSGIVYEAKETRGRLRTAFDAGTTDDTRWFALDDARPLGGSLGLGRATRQCNMSVVTTLLLIHGGLWEEMDADRLWREPGIEGGLASQGFDVLAPDRPRRPADWAQEVAHLAPLLPRQPVVVVAGSNGCSLAACLAVAAPDRVARLLLAWPATCDPTLDARKRHRLLELGASSQTATKLLAGGTMRGISDDTLRTLTMPVGLLPSIPENRSHQRRTIDELRRLLPDAEELPGCPEPPSPAFPPHLDTFIAVVARFAHG